jgi:mannose-6-phosphate isomerase-like protein (cupin superfamily)
MATIILEPGEVFEHQHDGESVTELLTGSVDLMLPSRTLSLGQREPVTVPSGTPHSMRNTGGSSAEVMCRCSTE